MQETVKSILRKASTKRSSRAGVSTNQDLSKGQKARYSGSESQDAQSPHDHYLSSNSRSRPLIPTNTGRDYEASQRHASENAHSHVNSTSAETESADVASNLDPQILADDLTGLSMDERIWCVYEENVADRNIEVYGIPPHRDDISMTSSGWPLPENNPSEPKEQKKHSIAHDLIGPSPAVASADSGEQSRSLPNHYTQPSRQQPPSSEKKVSFTVDPTPDSREDQGNPQKSHRISTEIPSSSVQSQHHMRSDSAVSHQPKDKVGQPGWKEQQRRLLEGVVDLEDSIDTDKDIKWAPAVTHEIVKTHEHEIIEPKIYREIHNYTYNHRILPVIQTEVLPPKHFIPNPNGEGLIEISEDQIPSSTTYRRTWDLVQKDSTSAAAKQTKWRTEPEIIEGETTISPDGFERRNTTIIYPPTIADMTEYEGVVQPVHFDHATGRTWLGDLTTVRKLEEQYPNAMKRAGKESKSTRRSDDDGLQKVRSSPSVRRKPVGSSDLTSA